VELEKLQRNSFAMPDFHANTTDAPPGQIITSFTSKITPCSSQADYKDSFTIRSTLFFILILRWFIFPFMHVIIANDQIF